MATSEVFWSDQETKRAIVWRFIGGMSWDELSARQEDLRKLRTEIPKDRQFTLIFDCRDMVRIPPFPISHMSAMRQRTPGNQDQIIIVINEGSVISRPLHLIVDVFQTIYSYPVLVVASIEAAYALVDKHYAESHSVK